MNDSKRNRANGFETLGGGKTNLNFNNPFNNRPQSSGGSLNGGSLKILGVIVLVILLLVVAFNSAYKIGEQEQGVLVTFGKAQPITDPGLHFKIPFVQ